MMPKVCLYCDTEKIMARAERWDTFENFYEDMFGSWQEGLTLDREYNELGYNKENCRRATWETQANNRRKRYDSRD